MQQALKVVLGYKENEKWPLIELYREAYIDILFKNSFVTVREFFVIVREQCIFNCNCVLTITKH